MNVPAIVANEYLVPKDYVKPDIKVGNYFLNWDSSSYGIAQKEVAELKRFVTDLAAYLSTALYEAAIGIQRNIKAKTGAREARRFEEAFSPRLLITRKLDNLVYTLQMRDDGTTIISRNETITSDGNKIGLTLGWDLGELLFNRMR
ncbi:MAG TPA: hypothetical protein VJZ68_01850 [Nitrososphaera sp.]|nr:hypothetical protein [Nitrososphaera sp.]